MSDIYRITYDGTAFGDNLFTAYITRTLCDSGIDARLDNPNIEKLVDCPLYVQEEDRQVRSVKSFNCRRQNRTGLQAETGHNVYSDLLLEFKHQMRLEIEIKANLNHVPVRFVACERTPVFDVAMVTETGWWTPYRDWPYFNELKKMLRAGNITFIDLSKEGIRGNDALNVVHNCKLYVGLETGVSHYVSRFANGKALIIQSGYCSFDYWAGLYEFSALEFNVECSPCWKRFGCVEHACMRNLKPEIVFNAICNQLSK